MHELTLSRAILDIINKRAAELNCQTVKTIYLEIGTLTGIDEESLRLSFTVLTKGNIAENARLEIIWVRGEATCDFCQETVMLNSYFEGCKSCGQHSLKITHGEELRVKSMEVG